MFDYKLWVIVRDVYSLNKNSFKLFALFLLPNNSFFVDNVGRTCILITCLGLKGLTSFEIDWLMLIQLLSLGLTSTLGFPLSSFVLNLF